MNKILTSSIVWVMAILSILIVQVVGAFAIVFLPTYSDLIVYGVMIAIQAINIYIVYSACKKREFKSPNKIAKINTKNTLLSVLLAIVTFVSMYLVSLYAFDFLTKLGIEQSEIRIDGAYLILALLSTVILAPIGEELVYRYVICGALQNKNTVLALIVSALCFTFMHMSPMQTIYQLALGVVLALIVIKSNNIVYAIITHATSNLIAIILALIPIPTINIYSPITIVVAVILFALGIIVVALLTKKMGGEKRETTIIQTTKQQKTITIFAYAVGFAVCLFMWITNFF